MPNDDTAYYEDLNGEAGEPHPLTASSTSTLRDTTYRSPGPDSAAADRKYRAYLRKIVDGGFDASDRTGVGTRKLVGRQLRFDLEEGFPLIGLRPIWAFGAFREMMWFLRGRTNIWHLLQDSVGIWTGNAYKNYRKATSEAPGGGAAGSKEEFERLIKACDRPAEGNFAGMWGEMGEIYGARWRDAGGVDQIDNLLQQLEENPDSRRLKVEAWKPAYHMPGAPESEKAEPPPCHTGFQVLTEPLSEDERVRMARQNGKKIRQEDPVELLNAVDVPKRRLHLVWSQRSTDSVLGLPFNIAGYGLLAHLLAEEAGMAVGDLVFQGGDCHVYHNHMEAARDLCERPLPQHSPEIEVPEAVSIFEHEASEIEVTGYDPNPKLEADLPMAA
ncbi:thymidylate synthase [Salinibacter ruber]|uniref:Thymidylate synthase n=1 Tax=Salinibacter ruber TaxID=146919 RepID=A0AAW5P730_9BACT|nr:thymidylate synthase [Salinibacter ruber]MCS4157715.1 thymidylate synthase [Salinibacter ruber]